MKELTVPQIEKINNIIIVAVWIVFFFSLVFLIDVKHTRYKLIGMELSILTLLGLWFFKVKEDLHAILNSVLSPLILLLTVFTLFYVFSGNRVIAFSQWQRMVFSCLAFFIAYKTFPLKYKPFLINALFIMGSLISIYGILQRYGGIGRIQVPKMGRVFATFGNPNFFASFLVGLIPLCFAEFYRYKKLWKLVLILPMLTALYYTGTRGAWLGLACAIVFLGIFRSKKIVIFIALFLIFGWFSRSQWMRQTQRLLIWRDTLKMTVAKPVFGVGLGRFHIEFPAYASKELLAIFPQGKFIVNYAHNEFLELLAETGIAGFGLYIWFLIIFYYTALKNRGESYERKKVNLGAVCGVTAILIHSFVSVNMRFAVSSIWVFMLMGISFDLRKEKQTKEICKADYKKLILGSVFFALLIFQGKIAVEPLVSQKKLAREIDFFDKSVEYNEKMLHEKIKKDPERALTYYELGWEQAKKKDFKNAIKSFEIAISLDSSLVGAYNNLGNIYYTIGQRNLAVKYYKQALKKNPNLTDAHFNLGYIYYFQGRLKKAAYEFNIVLKLDPKNYKAKIMLEKMVQ